MVKFEEIKKGTLFPAGEKNEAFAQFFVGQSYLAPLVNDPDISVNVSNVTFEPKCRNNWHIHHEGYQLLFVTGGEGWYQEAGQKARFLQAGDTVIIKQGIKHWHGAAADSWFTHLAVTAGKTEWCEPVALAEYQKLTQ